MKHLKIGLVALGCLMLLVAVGIALGGEKANAEPSGVGVRVANGEVAVNVPTDTALTAFDRFLDRFLPKENSGTRELSTLGAIASPDIQSPYLSVSGVRKWYGKSDSFIQGSTTLCSIESPRATSTLLSFSVYIDIASSTSATSLGIVKATTPSYQSTSTDIVLAPEADIAAGAHLAVVMFASSTELAANNNFVFSQANIQNATTGDYTNDYFVVGLSGGEGTGQYTPSGNCQAEFLEL